METWYVLMREPDVNHDHWGIRLLREDKMRANDLELVLDKRDFNLDNECLQYVAFIMHKSEHENRMFAPFHQGGIHEQWEKCSGSHYIEFWNLSGENPEGREKVEQLVKPKEGG